MNPFSSIAWVPGSELRLLGLRQQVPLPAELPHWTDFFFFFFTNNGISASRKAISVAGK